MEQIGHFMKKITDEFGLTCGLTDMEDKIFRPELKEACKSNVCGNYGVCHTCPPRVGRVDELIGKVSACKQIIVFQKVYEIEDSYDYEGMMTGQQDFKQALQKIAAYAKECFTGPRILGVGGCGICERCAARDETPCRFPERAISSLEAHAIHVAVLSEKVGMKYINGENTVTYFGGVFLK